MRILIVVLLAVVAVAAGGVWALGEFGGSLGTPVAKSEPYVREPALAPPSPQPAPAQPQQQADLKTKSTPVVRSAPIATPTPAPPPPPQPTPTPPPPAAAAASEPGLPQAAKPDAAQLAEADKPAEKPGAAARSMAPQSLDVQSAKPSEPTFSPAEVPAPPPTPAATPAAASAATVPAAAASAAPTVAQQYQARRVTYNRPPKTLVLDKPIDISLVINATDDADAGKKALEGFQGTVVERDVNLSDFVSAELAGTDFDIALQTTSPRQKLSPKIPNQWRWRVKPTKTGQHTLTLTIYGYASGSLDAEPLDAYRDDITVQVQEFDKLVNWAKSVQPVFAILAALAGATSALFAVLRFRHERKRDAKPRGPAA